jgi:hypothetical protein
LAVDAPSRASFAQSIADTFASFRDALRGILADDIGGRLTAAGLGGIGKGLHIPGFANGTNFAPGGLALVGERGPGLVDLPRGSRVFPNSALARPEARPRHRRRERQGRAAGVRAEHLAGRTSRRPRSPAAAPASWS